MPQGYNPLEDWQRQIAEYQRRLGQGASQYSGHGYDSGQFYEFQNRIASLQNMIKDYQKQNNQPQATPLNLPDPNQYFSDEKLKNFFNLGRANLYQMQEQSAAGAQRAARSNASSGNALNPAMFALNAGNQVRQGFSPQFGQLGAAESQALWQNQQALLDALTKQAQIQEGVRQFNVTDENQREALRQQWMNQLANFQAYQDQWSQRNNLNPLDYIRILFGGAQAAGSLGWKPFGG